MESSTDHEDYQHISYEGRTYCRYHDNLINGREVSHKKFNHYMLLLQYNVTLKIIKNYYNY